MPEGSLAKDERGTSRTRYLAKILPMEHNEEKEDYGGLELLKDLE
jgi:hypothetical protein